MQALRTHPNHRPHAGRLCAELGVAQQSSQVVGGVVHADIQPDKAICGVAEFRLEEILIHREQRRASLPVQQADDVHVLCAGCSKLTANLPTGDVPLLEQWHLIFGKVFVEKIHAAASWDSLRDVRRKG